MLLTNIMNMPRGLTELKPESRNKPHSASFTSLQMSDTFNHFRSVSYFEALTNSSLSGSRKSGINSYSSTQDIKQKMKIISNSTPCTPKKIEIQKYSTLPVSVSNNLLSNKKTRSSSLSSFFRRLRPKFHRSSSNTKNPWIVIEFSPRDSENVSSDESDKSNHSLELAVQSKAQHFTSLKDLHENSTSDFCNCPLSNKRKDNISPKCNFTLFSNSKKFEKNDDNFTKQKFMSEASIFFRLSPRRRLENVKQILKGISKRTKYQNSSSLHSLHSKTCGHTPSPCFKTNSRASSHTFSGLSQFEEDGIHHEPMFSFCKPTRSDFLRANRYSADCSYLLKVPKSSSNASLSSIQERSLNLANSVKQEKRECSTAEIKLPSYVGISCAINGYANYSRFCRSRDNSPARSSFRKSSLEPSMLEEMYSRELHSLPFDDMRSTRRCARSHSDSNGTMRSVYTESRHVTVSKQLQIPLKATKKYMTEITIPNGQHSSPENSSNSISLTNGHAREKNSLAKEVGIVGTKSLVQQRIESLYGKTICDEVKISSIKTSGKQKGLPYINGESANSNSPALKNHIGEKSLPVFRHVTKDFRKQLEGDTSDDMKFNFNHEISSIKAKKPLRAEVLPKPTYKESDVNSSRTNGLSLDECDKIATEILPVIQDISPEQEESSLRCDVGSETKKAGHKFLTYVDIEKDEIQIQIEEWEKELLNSSDIPEEASGKIRAACGKANLLLNQKFQQFRELCKKNIEEDPSVPFYTTESDLAGFWDMVMLQVDDINSTFKDIRSMKENDWKEDTPQKPLVTTHSKTRKTFGAISKSNPCTPKHSAKASESARAREEARKKLLAAKKKGRQQNSNVEDADVAIFTPASPK